MSTLIAASTTKTHLKQDLKQAPKVEPGIWFFVLGDMFIFTVFYAMFIYYQRLYPDTFENSQQMLNQALAAVNAFILLLSSYFVAMASKFAQNQQFRRVKLFLLAALICAILFVVIKVAEYGEKFSEGINLLTNHYFSFYFMFTGMHLVHVLIGICVLIYMLRLNQRKLSGKQDLNNFEGGAVYWHMVDLLWVVLFPVIYLL